MRRAASVPLLRRMLAGVGAVGGVDGRSDVEDSVGAARDAGSCHRASQNGVISAVRMVGEYEWTENVLDQSTNCLSIRSVMLSAMMVCAESR